MQGKSRAQYSGIYLKNLPYNFYQIMHTYPYFIEGSLIIIDVCEEFGKDWSVSLQVMGKKARRDTVTLELNGTNNY